MDGIRFDDDHALPPLSKLTGNPLFDPAPVVEDSDIFFSRFRICSPVAAGTVDDVVENPTLPSGLGDRLMPVPDLSAWEEVVTVANPEDVERQRKAMPLEELLQRQDVSSNVGEEDGKGKEVRVDKWGLVIEDDEVPMAVVEDNKKKEVEAARAEKWVEVVSKWDSYSSDKKKKVRSIPFLPHAPPLSSLMRNLSGADPHPPCCCYCICCCLCLRCCCRRRAYLAHCSLYSIR